MADRRVPEREEILALLIDLALGDSESYLPHGFDRAAQAVAFAGAEGPDGLPDATEVLPLLYDERGVLTEDHWEMLSRLSVGWARETYLAVAAGAPTFRSLLVDPEPAVRLGAGYAIAWFPDGAGESLAAVRRVLWGGAGGAGQGPAADARADDRGGARADARVEAERANLVLASGLLARYAADTADAPALERLLEGGAESLLAVAAALALEATFEGAPPPRAIEVLTGAVADGERVQEAGRELPWNGGDLAGYASLALRAAYGRTAGDLEAPVEALIRALTRAAPMGSLTVTGALLDLLFPEPAAGGLTRRAEDLSPLQRRALAAVARHGAWRIDGGLFVNYSRLVGAYGFPRTPEELVAYLERPPS